MPARDTHKWDRLHTRHQTYSRVHTKTHTNTNKRTAKRRCGLTPWRRPPHPSGGRLAPTPTASCISVAISHAAAMCNATESRCACGASHVDIDQLTKGRFQDVHAVGAFLVSPSHPII